MHEEVMEEDLDRNVGGKKTLETERSQKVLTSGKS